MLPEKIVWAGLTLQLIGEISYIVSIYRGHAKPNLVSWFIWMLAPWIGFFFQVKAGGGISQLPVFLAGFGPFLVILFSIFSKNGYWRIIAFDIYCGILAMLSLVLFVFTHSFAISILFALSSDALAAVPTIVKSWKFPETESAFIYFCAMISNVIGLLTIKTWSFSSASFGLALSLQCAVILFCIYRKKIFVDRKVA